MGFLKHGGYFFAYEGFWEFFVFRRRKNGGAGGIIFGWNRVILFGVAFMKSTCNETESQSAQQFRRYIFRIVLRSVLDRFSIGSRLVLDRSSINLRSFFVRSSIPERSSNGDRTELERRMNGELTENERRTNGARTENERRCFDYWDTLDDVNGSNFCHDDMRFRVRKLLQKAFCVPSVWYRNDFGIVVCQNEACFAKMERVLASLRVQSYNTKKRIPNFLQIYGVSEC